MWRLLFNMLSADGHAVVSTFLMLLKKFLRLSVGGVFCGHRVSPRRAVGPLSDSKVTKPLPLPPSNADRSQFSTFANIFLMVVVTEPRSSSVPGK